MATFDLRRQQLPVRYRNDRKQRQGTATAAANSEQGQPSVVSDSDQGPFRRGHYRVSVMPFYKTCHPERSAPKASEVEEPALSEA